jgi:uncharacterized protein (DUF983 family)
MAGGGEAGSTAEILWAGVRGRCPRCGRGALFDGFLTVTERCAACGLGFAGHDAGDGPAVFIILILGFAVVGLALIVEIAMAPPLWVHALLWTPLVVGGSVALLRPLKGITVALQFRFRDVDRPTRPGGS